MLAGRLAVRLALSGRVRRRLLPVGGPCGDRVATGAGLLYCLIGVDPAVRGRVRERFEGNGRRADRLFGPASGGGVVTEEREAEPVVVEGPAGGQPVGATVRVD